MVAADRMAAGEPKSDSVNPTERRFASPPATSTASLVVSGAGSVMPVRPAAFSTESFSAAHPLKRDTVTVRASGLKNFMVILLVRFNSDILPWARQNPGLWFCPFWVHWSARETFTCESFDQD